MSNEEKEITKDSEGNILEWTILDNEDWKNNIPEDNPQHPKYWTELKTINDILEFTEVKYKEQAKLIKKDK
jgi:hypothetical protein